MSWFDGALGISLLISWSGIGTRRGMVFVGQ